MKNPGVYISFNSAIKRLMKLFDCTFEEAKEALDNTNDYVEAAKILADEYDVMLIIKN